MGKSKNSENQTFWSFWAVKQTFQAFLEFLGRKTDFSGKRRTNLGAFFKKGPLSDQGLIKQTYLAALLMKPCYKVLRNKFQLFKWETYFLERDRTIMDRGKQTFFWTMSTIGLYPRTPT